MSKVIAVLGATGVQGGGLVKAILADPQKEFKVRAITRKPDSDKAKKLAAAGCEVVVADVDDVNSLTKAFEGAYGVFVVTNFWEHLVADKEVQQVKNVALASKKAGVKHVVNSTLQDSRKFVPLESNQMPTLQGKYKIPHFDAKGESAPEFERLGVPTTQYITSFYWENFGSYFPAQGQADGTYVITIPMGTKRIAGVAVDDIGGFALAMFKKPAKYIGKTVGIAGEFITMEDFVKRASAATGKTIKYQDIPAATFRGFPFPGADDLGNMFQFFVEFEDAITSARDIAAVKADYPALQSVDAWLATNKEGIAFKEPLAPAQ